jgi:glycogen synthase
MVAILDAMKMYLPTRGGPTIRKQNIAERSRHNTVFLVPQIPENTPTILLPPEDTFNDGKVRVYRANTLDHIPSDPKEFGMDFYEGFFALRADAMRHHIVNVHRNTIPGDVVQGNHFLELALGASAAAHELGLPFVYQLHAPISGFQERGETDVRVQRKTQFKELIERALITGGTCTVGNIRFNLKRPEAIVTISPYVRTVVADQYKYPAADISVVLNGLESHEVTNRSEHQESTQAFYKLHNIPSAALTVAYAGAVDELNGVKVLLEAMDSVARRADVHLVVAGADRKQLLAPYKGAPWLTHFERDLTAAEVRTLYRGANVMAMPRLDMGAADYILPLKPMEAVREGALLLLSEAVALKSTFNDAAVFVKQGDRADLEEKLVQLAASVPTNLLRKATEIYQRYPLWGDVVETYDTVFDKVTGR